MSKKELVSADSIKAAVKQGSRQIDKFKKAGGVSRYIHKPSSILGKGTSSVSKKVGEEMLGEIVESPLSRHGGGLSRAAGGLAMLMTPSNIMQEPSPEEQALYDYNKAIHDANRGKGAMELLSKFPGRDGDGQNMTVGNPALSKEQPILAKLTESLNSGPVLAQTPSRAVAEQTAQNAQDTAGMSAPKDGGWMWSMLPMALEALSGGNYMGEAAQAGASTLSNYQKRMDQMAALDAKKQERKDKLSAKDFDQKLKMAKTVSDQEKVIRQELNKESKKEQEIAQHFTKIQNMAEAEPTAAGDVSLIFAYMKMLDPTSVVRESEQATASNIGSIPQRIWTMFEKARTGQRLHKEVRKQFHLEAKRIFEGYKARFDERQAKYKGISDRKGLNWKNISVQSMYTPKTSTKIEEPKVSDVESLPTNDAVDKMSGDEMDAWLKKLKKK